MSRKTPLSDAKTQVAFKNFESYANYGNPNKRKFLIQKRVRLICSLTLYVSTLKVY